MVSPELLAQETQLKAWRLISTPLQPMASFFLLLPAAFLLPSYKLEKYFSHHWNVPFGLGKAGISDILGSFLHFLKNLFLLRPGISRQMSKWPSC